MVLLLFTVEFPGSRQVLLLLVTVPLRKEDLGRWWGILAGAGAVFAMFCIYLRFALKFCR